MSDYVVDDFKGNDGLLIQCIDSLLAMDAKGILVPHGIGGHARTLLKASKAALEQAAQSEQSAELERLRKCEKDAERWAALESAVEDGGLVITFENGKTGTIKLGKGNLRQGIDAAIAAEEEGE